VNSAQLERTQERGPDSINGADDILLPRLPPKPAARGGRDQDGRGKDEKAERDNCEQTITQESSTH